MNEYVRFFYEQREEVESRIEHDTPRYRKAFASIEVLDAENKPVNDVKVHIKQVSHEFKFGCNLFMLDQFPDEEHNQKYKELFPNLFNYAIAPFYWSDFELTDGNPRTGKNAVNVYRRPAPEKVIDYCNEKQLAMKGHPLFWHQFLPDWLVRDRDEAMFRIDKRLRELSGEYGGRIRDWDAVNESLSRRSHFQDFRLPTDYVFKTFKKAEKYFTNNRLFINETTTTSWQRNFLREFSAYYMQIENLLLKGAQIDGIGLQYHLFRKPEELVKEAEVLLNPKCLFDVMDTYGKFQRPLQISEITVPAYGGTAESQEVQAEITEWLYRIWFSHPNSEAIVWWNFVDGTAAYAPLGSKEGENYFCGGLLNYDMTEKPVYQVLDKLINKEWRTEEDVVAQNGKAKFHGYFGKYEVSIEAAGRKEIRYIDLRKNGDRKFIVSIG